MSSEHAKVFLSCGQNSEEERAAARNIASTLSDMGFVTYVATEEQTLKGLRENIFWNLETAEYFVFVDFCREQLANKSAHRGSLFSNQELALASYLDLDVIAFQQNGMIPLDGVMKFLQANAELFDDASELPERLRTRVARAGWRSNWKRQLEAEICEPPFTDTIDYEGAEINRFFHLSVNNLHHRRPALGCSCLVESIECRAGDQPVESRPVEVHWAGSTEQHVTIPARGSREVDIGFITLTSGSVVFQFNSFSTSSQYLPALVGPATYRAKYTIISQTFPPTSVEVELHLGSDPGDSRVSLVMP